MWESNLYEYTLYFLVCLKEFVETSVVKVDACECVIRGLSWFLAFEVLVERSCRFFEGRKLKYWYRNA